MEITRIITATVQITSIFEADEHTPHDVGFGKEFMTDVLSGKIMPEEPDDIKIVDYNVQDFIIDKVIE